MRTSRHLLARSSSLSLPARLAGALVAGVLLIGGARPSLAAAPPEVPFPAAAGVRPVVAPLGPERVSPVTNALSQYVFPEDLVFFDFDNGAIDVVTGGYNGTTGVVRTVASTSVGSGVPFTTQNISQGCVSPTQQLYYFDANTRRFVSLDLTNAAFPRTPVPFSGSNATLPYALSVGNGNQIIWDFSTSTIIYHESGAPQGATSTVTAGIYRYNPVAGTNTRLVDLTAATYPGGTVGVFSLTVTPTGTIYGLFSNTSFTTQAVALITPGSTSFTRVDGGAGATPAYNDAFNVSWDFYNQKINVYNEGADQTTASILHITPVANAGSRAYIVNGSAGPAPTYGGSVFNLPVSGYTNTTGRLYYTDFDQNVSYTFPATIPPTGQPTASEVGTAHFGSNGDNISFVPPTLPAITTLTATNNGSGTAETLGATVTSAGTALVTPAVQARGVVYSLTSTNAAPAIGGTGVTQVAASAATGVFSVNATALTANSTYSYAAYVSTYYGTVYTAVSTFATPTTPTVSTTTPATSLTGTSAALGGNVTSNGGTTLTARGIVYAVSSTNGAPTIGGTGVTNLTDASTATGTYTDAASGLAVGTTYSFRAYATNGVGTTYGAISTFATLTPPTANSQSVTTAFNTAKAITLSGSDPQGQNLTYTVTTASTHGTLSGTSPNLTYTPTANYQGADSFTFTVTDTSNLTSSTATVSITVTAGTPTATSQSVNVNLNLPKAVTLAGTDPDSPALALTYTVATQPANGTLSGTAPNLTYTPATGFAGTDSFTFTVNNGQRTSAAATVNLTVIGEPTISGFTPAAGGAGTTVTVTGTNLQNATALNFFRNAAGTGFTVVSSTQVTVVVPAGAKTGLLTVLSGAGSNNSSTKFAVTP